MKTALSFVALATAASALPAAYVEANHELLWSSFKSTYNKKYSGVDEAVRKATFKKNMLKASELEKENPHATFGMNAFSDLTEEEFKVYHSLKLKDTPDVPRTFSDAQVRELTATPVDWRSKGAVTHIKNQAQCGSCWAFSTTGGIEGQNFLAGHGLVSLSEQELVSCSVLDLACSGGSQGTAMEWLQVFKGGKIVTEDSYPYTSGTGKRGECKETKDLPVGARITGHKGLSHNEDEMAAFVASRGPLSVSVDASSWQTYTGGLMTNCKHFHRDHAVLIVGFTDDAWIVKNSWGTSWGEQGYIRLQRGTNQCLIKEDPITSTV